MMKPFTLGLYKFCVNFVFWNLIQSAYFKFWSSIFVCRQAINQGQVKFGVTEEQKNK